MKTSLRISIILVAAYVMTGCAFTPEQARIVYSPREMNSRLPGADMVKVRVAMTDSRPVAPNKVGHKSNAYGMECASINATAPVAGTVTKAMELELTNSGFTLGEGGAVVRAELNKLYNRWLIGFWSGSALAEFSMKVNVTSAQETPIQYSKMIYAEGLKDKCQLTSGQNAEIALSAAMTKGIHQFMEDPAFTKALFEVAEKENSRLSAGQTANTAKSKTMTAPKSENIKAKSAGDPTMEEFQRLKQLKADGLITDEEFEAARKRMANKLLKDDAADSE